MKMSGDDGVSGLEMELLKALRLLLEFSEPEVHSASSHSSDFVTAGMLTIFQAPTIRKHLL